MNQEFSSGQRKIDQEWNNTNKYYPDWYSYIYSRAEGMHLPYRERTLPTSSIKTIIAIIVNCVRVEGGEMG